ncbi:MAG: L-aspartate oxidase [Acidobacteriota bacterium]
MTESDVLVIGSGLAGLRCALTIAERADVIVLTKKGPSRGSTAWAQGGISAVLDADDSVDLHVEDTLRAGAGLCDESIVRATCAEGAAVISDLQALGVEFSGGSAPDLGREGGHGRRRIVHAGDHTGASIHEAVLRAVEEHPRIRLLPDHFAVDLIVERREQGRSRCLGAFVLHSTTGVIESFGARRTILATGGSGKVYLYTTNDDVSSGDGVAMAYRAGCRVANLEFCQFHPTCLYHPHAKSFLISEAVRGEGGILLKGDGGRLMEGQHPQGDLAPRDIVARAIDRHMKESGEDCVYLDVTRHDDGFLRERFPTIHERCAELGIRIGEQPIPVVPAAHYQCGGVLADLSGRTDLDGLLAIGEVACTGMHCANRLASNSLLEAAVMAHRAAALTLDELAQPEADARPELPSWDVGAARPSDETVVVTHSWEEIRRFTWNYVGIFRSDTRLKRAQRRIALIEEEIKDYYWRFIVTPDLLELRNLAHLSRLVIESALSRKESRGLHCNLSHPATLPELARPTVLVRPTEGEVPLLVTDEGPTA